MPPLCLGSAPLGVGGSALWARSSPRNATHIRGPRSPLPPSPRSASQSPTQGRSARGRFASPRLARGLWSNSGLSLDQLLGNSGFLLIIC